MKFAIKLFVTIIIFITLTFYVDYKSLGEIISKANPIFLIFAIVFQFLSTLLASYRWYFIMGIIGFKLNFGFYFRSYFKGSFFNQLLPSNIGGDAVRVINLKDTGYSLKDATYGVLIDRVLGIKALLILNIISNLLSPELLPDSIYRLINIICISGIASILFLILFHKSSFLSSLPVIRLLSELSLKFYTIFRETKNFIKQMLYSILVHIFSILSLYMISIAVGLNIDFWTFLVIIPVVILFMVLPISLAGWGIREGAMVGLFSLVGAQKEVVFLVSIIYGFIVIITILPGFYFWASDRQKYL